MPTLQETFIPAGAWINPDGTVEITIGGQRLDGGHGVNMQTAIHALRRYASQHGPLLMTTLRPDGRSTMDTVYPDGTIRKYETPEMSPAGPLGHGSLSPAADLDFFGLPPLGPGHTPPPAHSRHSRADAFSDRPVFRPVTHAPVAHDHHAPRKDHGMEPLKLQRNTTQPYHAAPAAADPGASGQGMSVKAVATKKNRALSSPLRTIAFLIATILLVGALALYGPMIVLHPGSSDPLQFWQGGHAQAPPQHPPPKTAP